MEDFDLIKEEAISFYKLYDKEEGDRPFIENLLFESLDGFSMHFY